MSINVVRDFIIKIADRSLSKEVRKVEETLKECLLNVQTYINETVDEYLGTSTYSDLEIAEWIYKDDIDATDEETYVKVNLFEAKTSLERIIAAIYSMPGGLIYRNIYSFRYLLRDFLHDIGGFVNFYQKKQIHLLNLSLDIRIIIRVVSKLSWLQKTCFIILSRKVIHILTRKVRACHPWPFVRVLRLKQKEFSEFIK